MPSYEHKRIAEHLVRLDTLPAAEEDYQRWIEAPDHLDFLRINANSKELVLYASPEYSFVYAMAVSNDRLVPADLGDLLGWSCNPYSSAASFVYGGGREDVWIESGPSATGAKALEGGMQLIYGRAFEGWTGSGRNYFELNQEFAHASGIHWRPEHQAYCRYDEQGDLAHVVSITGPQANGLSLVTCQREPLDEYLSASNMSLVRMFDFTLLRRDGFSTWPDGEERIQRETDEFQYRQKVASGIAAYTRGFQIIRPAHARQPSWGRRDAGPFVEFTAMDWRNKRVARISTDPKATTNYFQAQGNELPFELSPAFFRPEVLLKYKADREKYTVGERDISCRAAWYLKAFDVNEAGQVFAYICYLRDLPHSEQLHWASFNEEPKAGISKRAFQNDFEGDFADTVDPLQGVLSTISVWHAENKSWWKLRNPDLIERISKPVSSSRDEWAEAHMDLSKLVIEGFVVAELRQQLEAMQVSYDPKGQSIVLLEQILRASDPALSGLAAMRTVQRVRSKVKGHAGNEEAETIVREAIADHGSLPEHFSMTCRALLGELTEVARVLG